MDVLIVNYNTPKLVAAAVQSLWLHTPEAKVTIFDNSDVRPFPADEWPEINYIDNTRGQVFRWEKVLERWPDKLPTKNNWGSAMHCYSVDVCMDRFPDGFVLMDSDILIKRDITPLCDKALAWKAGVQHKTRENSGLVERIEPYLCWINTPMLRQKKIRYFNPKKMWHLVSEAPGKNYDTGAWLKEACDKAKLPGKEIALDKWIEHYGNGSWRKAGSSPRRWLEQHKDLWWQLKDTKIYVCTHTDFKPVVKSHVYETIDARDYNGDLCDNGLRGSFYSELILYKYMAERDDLPKYVGFCGYRKYFSFMDEVPDIPLLLQQYDCIAATPVEVKPSVRAQYETCHNKEDLDIVSGIIREDYPDLWVAWQKSLERKEMYACNMFIMKRKDFRRLIQTVFEILDKYLDVVGTDIEKRISDNPEAYHVGRNKTSTAQYQYRIGGYLGERIVNALIRNRFRERLHYDRIITQKAIVCP